MFPFHLFFSVSVLFNKAPKYDTYPSSALQLPYHNEWRLVKQSSHELKLIQKQQLTRWKLSCYFLLQDLDFMLTLPAAVIMQTKQNILRQWLIEVWSKENSSMTLNGLFIGTVFLDN